MMVDGNLALLVRDEAMRLAQAGFGSRFKTYRNTPALQAQPIDLPVLGIYILRERRTALGSWNHAAPKFHFQLTLGLSGAVQADTGMDEQNQLLDLERWMTELDDFLLRDPGFVQMTEGIESMDRQSQYAKQGETTVFEIRVEMVLHYTGYYEPIVPDVLEKVVVDSQFPDKEHADSGTPQIHREYEIETEETS
jgi:hypothetical protein